MKVFYLCTKPVGLFVFILFFLIQSSHNIYAQCTSCSDGPPGGIIQSCDNFESYTANKALPANSMWRALLSGSALPNVQSFNNSKVINLSYSSNFDPNVLYRMGNKNGSRFRLSWNMFINPNKEGNFSILHNMDSQVFTSNAQKNEAYSVDFKKTGKAYLNIAGKAKQDSFSYTLNAWNQVMQIIDIDQNRVELWMNGQFIRSWAFNLGRLSASKNLGALNFWTQNSADYSFYVDNICYWEKSFCNTGIGFDPVCIQNGQTYLTSIGAGCNLYTFQEYTQGNCERICDYASKFIDVDAPFESGKLSNQSLPLSVQQVSCVYDFFGYVAPKKLYGAVFAIKLGGGRHSIAWKTANGKKSKAFLFSCSCSGVLCTQSCVPVDDFKLPYTAKTGEQVVSYYVEQKGFYYVALIAEEPLDYSNLNVTFCPPDRFSDPALPELRSPTETSGCGPCKTLNPIVLIGDTTFIGNFSGEGNDFSQSSKVYENCSGKSDRLYEGEDIVLKFLLDKPRIMSLSVTCISSIGVFLYGSDCGIACLDLAESSDQGGTATMSPLYLKAGEYYIIIDKNTKFREGATQFTLDLKFQDESSLDFVSSDASCPKEISNPHQIRIRSVGALMASELSLTKNDRISFVYDKGQNNYQLVQGQYWNGQELLYNFYADKSGDKFKCSYAPGDSFEVRIVNQGTVLYVKPKFNAGSELAFKQGAQSVVNGFTKVARSSFMLETSTFRASAFKNQIFETRLVSTSNLAWSFSNIPSWIKIEPTSGTGDSDILITILSDNPSNQLRKAELQLTNTEQFLRILLIEQKACTVAAADLGPDVQVCTGESLVLKATGKGSFRWGNNSTASTFTVNTNTPGISTYMVTATSGTCTARDTIKVTVNTKPIVNLGADKNICSGDSVQLNASGGGTYQWSQTNATSASIFVAPSTTTTYVVSVSKDGCQANDQIVVNVQPKPVANAGLNQAICSGKSTVLTATGGSSYKWSANNATTASITVTPTASQSYTVMVSQNNCESTAEVLVTINPTPVANAGADQNICAGKSTRLTASGGGTYRWSTGNATTASITLIPASTQTYVVTVTQGLCSSTDEVIVKVNPNPVITKESVRPAAGSFGNIQVKVSGGTPNYQYQWFRNDTLVSTQEDLVGLKAGTSEYKLVVTDANGCSATFGPEKITRIETIPSLTQLDVFPNPSSGEITIKGQLKAPEVIQLHILDATGRRIWTSQQDKLYTFEHNLNLHALAKGMYWLQVQVAGYSSYKKFILN